MIIMLVIVLSQLQLSTSPDDHHYDHHVIMIYMYVYVWNKSPIMSYEGNQLDGGVLCGILMATSLAPSLISKSVSEA